MKRPFPGSFKNLLGMLYIFIVCLLLGQHFLDCTITSVHQTSDILDCIWPAWGTSSFLVCSWEYICSQKSGFWDWAAFLSESSVPCKQLISVFPASRISLSFFHAFLASCWYLVNLLSVLHFHIGENSLFLLSQLLAEFSWEHRVSQFRDLDSWGWPWRIVLVFIQEFTKGALPPVSFTPQPHYLPAFDF